MKPLDRYQAVRQRSVALCAPLAIEDHVPQPVEWVSPPKWHLAHTTWFFETMVLLHGGRGYTCFHPQYSYLFNSYYESIGARVQRTGRGHLSRPTVAEVHAYRAHVDAAMHDVLTGPLDEATAAMIELGLQHEEQHQELLLTDIKYILGSNPLRPVYATGQAADLDMSAEHAPSSPSVQPGHVSHPGGLCEVGHTGEGFCFDNEGARHLTHLQPFEISRTLVSNRDYLAFMQDGAYQRPELWHSEGWAWLASEGINAPLYWFKPEGDTSDWWAYTLAGPAPIQLEAPVSHVSYFEAHAYAQWAGARLPTEFEWEAAHAQLDWGARWEWTESAYLPYPGFRKAEGAVGEYNGKFMVGQQVLRGSSFATPPGHSRPTYRNFFHPPLRWQYTGIRLARG
jgi:ergothioneine biosynthesis protein EgtB